MKCKCGRVWGDYESGLLVNAMYTVVKNYILVLIVNMHCLDMSAHTGDLMQLSESSLGRWKVDALDVGLK